MLAGLRTDLDALGLTPFDVQLPQEHTSVAPLEGALRLREAEQGGFVLETVDYGMGYWLGEAATEDEARALLLDYVRRPLPPIRAITSDDLDTLVGRVSLHYFGLRDRVRETGTEGLEMRLPPDLPVDRLGAFDGTELYPVETPFAQRAQGPWSLRPENDIHTFLTTADLRVNAVIKSAWFGQPGGGLRFRILDRGVGIRDLVATGRLQRIHVRR